jgi:hypothetical protein
METFSLTAGSIGITAGALAGFAQLHSLIERFAEAHAEVRDTSRGLELLQLPLSALAQLGTQEQAITIAAKEDLNKVGVADAVNHCGDSCAKFAKDLERWTKNSSAGKLSFKDRFLVGVWKKEKICTLTTQLQSCAETLQLAVSSTQL